RRRRRRDDLVFDLVSRRRDAGDAGGGDGGAVAAARAHRTARRRLGAGGAALALGLSGVDVRRARTWTEDPPRRAGTRPRPRAGAAALRRGLRPGDPAPRDDPQAPRG